MNIIITGICGFVGSALARSFREQFPDWTVGGIDNLSRAGSETNRGSLQKLGVRVKHGDVRNASDVDALPDCDWVIDAAANPSVLAGMGDGSSSRQVVEHNLYGTVNLLEFCRARRCGLLLLSTSRVYSIKHLSEIPMEVSGSAFCPCSDDLPHGVRTSGVTEDFPTSPPVSLYGNTKLASENLALEYHETFGVPVWINRCGVLAGAGQFGRIDQGIYSFWINSYLRRRPLRYIGFGGEGHQVRDCLHPRDLVVLLTKQMQAGDSKKHRIVNAAGGTANSLSLAQLSDWCRARFGAREIGRTPEARRFDVPWLVLDSSRAAERWDWKVQTPLEAVLEEIAVHAEAHPDWLERSEA